MKIHRSSFLKIVNFYKPIMARPDIKVNIGTWDEAEAIKIFYNTFISTKVALVNHYY